MKYMLETATACALLVGIVLTGCAHAPRAPEMPEAGGDSGEATSAEVRNGRVLLDREWMLVSIGSVGMEDAVGDAVNITLEFSEDSQIRGSAGCNRYFARYEMGIDAALSIGEAGSTMMMCPDEIMQWEIRYLRALEHVTSYRVQNKRLLLLSGNNDEEVLTFVEEDPSAQSGVSAERDPIVESSRDIPFAPLNDRIRQAVSKGEFWVRDPLLIALEFKNVNEAKVVRIKREYVNGESPDSSCVTIVAEGYADDSISATWTQLTMRRMGDGIWQTTQAKEAYQCRRGQCQNRYSAELCP